MKYARKFMALFLAGVLAVSAAACGKKDAVEEPQEEVQETQTEEEENEEQDEEIEELPVEEVALEGGDSDASDESNGGTGEVTTEEIYLDTSWTYADSVMIGTGNAVLYHTGAPWNGITVGVNAGHGTSGSTNYKTYCHPDRTPKVTGGTTAAGSIQAVAVSSGMTFSDGTPEREVTLREAQILRDMLLEAGYNVLMIRDGEDVQLDNVARTVICNNMADCHIAIHWDGDGLGYDKGCFYIKVPEGIKYMEPVASVWEQDDALGQCLIDGLTERGAKINGNGYMAMDLTQTSYSSVPSVDIEMGNQSSDHSEETLSMLAEGLLAGVNAFFGL